MSFGTLKTKIESLIYKAKLLQSRLTNITTALNNYTAAALPEEFDDVELCEEMLLIAGEYQMNELFQNKKNWSYHFSEATAEKVPALNTSNGTNFQGTYSRCSNLTNIPMTDTSKGTVFNSFAGYCTKLNIVPNLDFSKADNISYAFYNCNSLKYLPKINCSNATVTAAIVRDCSNLVDIDQINFTAATNAKYAFYGCDNLKNITFVGSIKTELDFRQCPRLTVDSLMSIINALVDLTGQTKQPIYLGETNIAKLTAEQLLIIEGKNWEYS